MCVCHFDERDIPGCNNDIYAPMDLCSTPWLYYRRTVGANQWPALMDLLPNHFIHPVLHRTEYVLYLLLLQKPFVPFFSILIHHSVDPGSGSNPISTFIPKFSAFLLHLRGFLLILNSIHYSYKRFNFYPIGIRLSFTSAPAADERRRGA